MAGGRCLGLTAVLCAVMLWGCQAVLGRGEETGAVSGSAAAESAGNAGQQDGRGAAGEEDFGVSGESGASGVPSVSGEDPAVAGGSGRSGSGGQSEDTAPAISNPEYGKYDWWQEDGGKEGAKAAPEDELEARVVIATDIHYLADQLADGNCESFVCGAENGDGRVLPYLWQITAAFFDQVKSLHPDFLVLSGDLAMDGEKLSHQELAELLGGLEDQGIEVLVIPGNHDINNAGAKGYREDTVYPTENITAPEFAEIYGDFGYEQAEERDPASLSYVYKLDDYFQFLMLDSCQYDPVNLVGGALQNETYDWVEDVLNRAWEMGVRTIPVTHHNLFDQSGVSRAFFDNCTIMHDEKLIEMFEDNDVRLHLSGHLHIQHYVEQDGICEVVTGSLLMDPFQYGVIDILRDGDIHYYNQQVDVERWAKEKGSKNEELLNFSEYGMDFMRQVNYGKAYRELKKRVDGGDIALSDADMVDMASYYAVLCENYYAGTMYKIIDKARRDPAYDKWMDIDFISETSSFLDNILEDPAYNYNDVWIRY